MRYVIKRDGRKRLFDQTKIYKAIESASIACDSYDEEKIDVITDAVVKKLNEEFGKKSPAVEEVQDTIEKVLVEFNEEKIAKTFILYRAERNRIRDSKTRLMKTIHDITFKSSKENDIKRENANIDGDTAMGTMLKYGSETAKEFYLSQVIDPKFSKAHINGDIHIHDLDFYSLTMTCCQIDLIELFKNGFSTGDGYIREPNSIRSYASLACIAIQANQNDQHGGQSVPNFDYAMAIGVKKTYTKKIRNNVLKVLSIFDDELTKDEVKEIINNIALYEEPRMCNDGFHDVLKTVLTEKYPDLDMDRLYAAIKKNAYEETEEETYQAMEALIHNLNTMHSRAGAQVPFSSLNYGTDTSCEGRMVMNALLDATIAGLGDGQTPIFPIQIFKVKSGVNYNPTDPNYDLFKKAIVTSGKRLFPNFSFLDAPYNLQYYKEEIIEQKLHTWDAVQE